MPSRSAFFYPWSGLIDWLLQSDQKPLKPQKTFCQKPSLSRCLWSE